MNSRFNEWLIISFVFWGIDFLMIVYMILKRLIIYKNSEKFMKLSTIINIDNEKNKKRKISKMTIEYLEIKKIISLEQEKVNQVEKIVNLKKLEKKYGYFIRSFSKIKRMKSAVYLGLIATEKSREILEKALLREKNYNVKLYMVNALVDINNIDSIDLIVKTIYDAPKFYRTKVNVLISEFGEKFNNYLPKIIKEDNINIKELILDFSSVYFSELTKNYIISISMSTDEKERKLVHRACKILSLYYTKILNRENYLNSSDIKIKKYAIKALGNYSSNEMIYKLINFLQDKQTSRTARNAIFSMIERNPLYINIIADLFLKEKNIELKNELGIILSNKIEYFIMKLLNKNNILSKEIINGTLKMGKTSEIIDFLNKNKNIDIENELIDILKQYVSENENLKLNFEKYLNSRILEKMKLTSYKEEAIIKTHQKDQHMIKSMYILLIFCFLFFPFVFLIKYNNLLLSKTFLQNLRDYIINFNYYLAYYSLSINFIYIILLFFSNINAKNQVKLWELKSMSLLFKKRILPSVSIVAPAYNEAKTIIESANSLLNLKYPDYELIIVNDGSKDDTLPVLINYFNLKRIDYVYESRLKTKEIRGIYVNRSIPKLIVVDKNNGGKADSLNAGINISNKDYFCGIDADSLLEEEALIKLASLTIDENREIPALGGNIFPINGCEIEKGEIKKISIPKNPIAILQTTEYIRAFMAGRMGWAYINSLLIISGAFGLFDKNRVIEAGGYLTSSGIYKKDTVGEDMELVVRLAKNMHEQKEKFKICYSFKANCWTEVPEDLKTLKKQRYRWHRGLIEILVFHKKIILNPKYKKIGFIAMPYFLIFEMMGPIIEIQGYIMVLLSILLGLFNKEIAMLIFSSTILMGIMISVASLLIAEKDTKYFKLKELFKLISYAIIENFGPRQLISLWRVTGYFNAMKKPAGWDKAERKGFETSKK